MSFASVITALQTTLQGATGYSANQVAYGKESQLTKGYTPVVVIQYNPRLEMRREGMGGAKLHVWHIDLEVAAQYRSATLGPPALQTAWQAILDQIDAWPNLQQGAGSFIREAHVERALLEPLDFSVGNLHFAKVILTVNVTEQLTVVEQE